MLAGYISSISQIYAQHTDIELEAKYGHYYQTFDRGVPTTKFDSTVPYVHFERLLNFLQSNVEPENQVVEVSDVRQANVKDKNGNIRFPGLHPEGQVRQIVITPEGDGPQEVVWQQKYPLMGHIDLQDYDIRVSANKELAVTPVIGFVPEVIRCRVRYSFFLANKLVRADLTRVMMTNRGKSENRFEVELEYHGGIDTIHIFQEQIESLFKLLRGTHLMFTNTAKMQLIDDTNRILGSKHPGMIDKTVLSEARNIKMRDLVYGGIVGNKDTNYLVTFKADGLRKMLIIHHTGIWLVYPPFEFNLVLNVTTPINGIDQLLMTLNGTIFDGEWVQPKVPRDISYWYLVFDCLAMRNDASIQNRSYAERRQIVDAISRLIQTPILTLDTKDTREITTPDEFFYYVTDFLNKRDTLPYEEDGLMFFPAQMPYNLQTRDQINKVTRKPYKLHERSLTRVPDICKWKEQGDITIDFALKWALVQGTDSCKQTYQGLELCSFDMEKRQMVPFKGSDIYPLTPNMIDSNNPLTQNKPSDLVVEYEWIDPTVDPNIKRKPIVKYANGMLRPRRIRYDKSGPNRLDVALDDWEDIMNPITAEDLKGETIKLTRAYFNRVKTDLYRLIARQFPGGANILDIGSGKGGDVSKWKIIAGKGAPGTGNIIAVEPNDENRAELISRIKTYHMQDKVVIVPTGGQDTKTITDVVSRTVGKVDAITLMLSLSFFWEQESYLDALVNTIVNNLKPGGIIVFLTVNGDVIEQIFEPPQGPIITDKRIVTADLHLYPRSAPPSGRALDFNLPDTIVGEQREYLVHLQDLTTRLARYGIVPAEFKVANSEKLLSRENQLYASMFTYGHYINTDPSKLPSTVTPIQLPSTLQTITPIQLPSTLQTVTPIQLPSQPSIVTPLQLPSQPSIVTPLQLPTVLPSIVPSQTSPSIRPVASPSVLPSIQPVAPSVLPSIRPVAPPSVLPSIRPVAPPSVLPSIRPVAPPSVLPSIRPVAPPSVLPSIRPVAPPSVLPSIQPVVPSPSVLPSIRPVVPSPSVLPSIRPVVPSPSVLPSIRPVVPGPSVLPSIRPVVPSPSMLPSIRPVIPSAGQGFILPTGSTARPSGKMPSTPPALLPYTPVSPSKGPTIA